MTRAVQAVSGRHPVLSLIRLGRPKFLLGGLALFGLGTLLAYLMGYGFDAAAYIWGQVGVTSIQWMTHYSNDYFDLEADRANHHPTHWSGGSRVLVRGELPRWSALAAAMVLIVLSCTAAVALVFVSSAPAGLVVGMYAAMLFLSWSYSCPPLRLHSRGLGEPAVAVVVPFLTPLSGFVVQAGTMRLLPVMVTLPLVFLQLAMLLTLQIPDASGDRTAGKMTWTVLFGVRPIVVLSSVLIILAFAVGLGSSLYGAPFDVGVAWLFLIPVGILQLVNFARRDFLHPRDFNRIAFWSTALFFLAIVADIVGFSLASLGNTGQLAMH